MPRINVYYPVGHSSVACSPLSNGNHRRIKDDPPGSSERRGIVLDDRFDGPLTCVEWTLILLRSLGWTPCVSLYFLTVTSFFPFEFLVICGILGFMEADKFFFYHNRVDYTFPFVERLDRDLKFGLVGEGRRNRVQIPLDRVPFKK